MRISQIAVEESRVNQAGGPLGFQREYKLIIEMDGRRNELSAGQWSVSRPALNCPRKYTRERHWADMQQPSKQKILYAIRSVARTEMVLECIESRMVIYSDSANITSPLVLEFTEALKKCCKNQRVGYVDAPAVLRATKLPISWAKVRTLFRYHKKIDDISSK